MQLMLRAIMKVGVNDEDGCVCGGGGSGIVWVSVSAADAEGHHEG